MVLLAGPKLRPYPQNLRQIPLPEDGNTGVGLQKEYREKDVKTTLSSNVVNDISNLSKVGSKIKKGN